MGPIEVIIISFPDIGLVAGISPLLEDLVDTGHVRVVDAILVTRGRDGDVVVTDLDDSVAPRWSSISSEPQPLLSAADAALVIDELGRDGAAVIFAIEHAWPDHLSRLAADSGGIVQLHARIDPETVATAARVVA